MTDEQRDRLIEKHGRDILAAAASMLALKLLIARCKEPHLEEASIEALSSLMRFTSRAISKGEPQPIIDACEDIDRVAIGDTKGAKKMDEGLFKFDLGES